MFANCAKTCFTVHECRKDHSCQFPEDKPVRKREKHHDSLSQFEGDYPLLKLVPCYSIITSSVATEETLFVYHDLRSARMSTGDDGEPEHERDKHAEYQPDPHDPELYSNWMTW